MNAPSTITIQEEQPDNPIARNALERALLKLPAGTVVSSTFFPSDEEMNEKICRDYASIITIGVTRLSGTSDNPEETNLIVVGLKPTKGDKTPIWTIPIPHTVPAQFIRLWDGGMRNYGLFCLDFVDSDDVLVSLPEGCKLIPDGWPQESALRSWEEGYSRGHPENPVVPGTEWFGIPSDVSCRLVRDGLEDLWFHTPHIPNHQHHQAVRMTMRRPSG
ncbi:hypothetical protein D9758_004026 [Tetrapyrgos nigripes]|uniref:Uncharacterized protein n=1 Tax=Tetrapyrgos nigripes TaxID=182062 RepID=A0A8H5GLE3_9AGAR|nr:hypothetical protein D9758_004026 [Tetrapyrgos nigripes]